METFLLGCFVFGFLFTVASVVMGATHGALDGLGIHGDAGPVDLGSGVPHAHGYDWLGQLNLSALMAFLMWFGGAGWLALRYGAFGTVLSAGTGVVAGVVAYAIVAGFVAKLRASETVMNPDDYVLDGTVARVTVPAAAGGVGEIVFTLAGVKRVEGARAADGQPLAKGTEVVITGYERGMAVVQDAKTFVETLPAGQKARAPEALPPQARTPEREPDSH
jgi:hypothetical protein